MGENVLIGGMVIWNAYLQDLTGDGLPEICSEISFGSGMIDNHILVFDYGKGVCHELWDRGFYDFHLRLNASDGFLYADQRSYNSQELVCTGRLVFKDGMLQIEGMNPET